MPGFRFPVSIPKTLGELFERIRELLPQLEARVLPNRLIGTTETKIAHGLKSTPVFVVPSHPHCIAVVKETRRPDQEFIYLKATNPCVVNVWTLAVGELGRSLVPDGGYKLPDWDPSGDALGDHKFSIDATDEAADGFDYAETKLVGSSTVTLTKTTGTHGKAIQFTAANQDDHLVKARNADATTVGGLMEKTGPSDTITPELYTDPITGTERVRFNAAAPTPTPGEGSWLYTGSIQETNLLDPVKAFVKSLQGMGGLDPGQAELWDVLESGDYQHKAVGQLYGLAPDGTETFALSLGQRVWLTVWTESGGTYRGGLFTISTLGDGSTKAVLHPVASPALAVGDMFTVEGVGAEFEGWYWEVLSLPDMAIAYRPEYANETTHNLFTSTQVSQAGSVTRETEVTIPGGTSGGTMFVIPYFEMLDVLGVSTIPKGVVNWEIKAYVVADDPAATVFIRAHLTTDQGVLDRFGYGDTPPIHNTSAAVLKMQGTIAADRTVDPAAKLGAVFYGYSNSASAVTIKLVFNDAGHSTRVQTPLTTASFGTLDHGLLTPVSRKFPDTDQGRADAVTWAHPQSGIQPGRIHTPLGATVATADGLFAIPSDSNLVVLSGTEDILGCSTDGFTAGDYMEFMVLSERKILRSQSVGTGYANFIWGSVDTGYSADYNEIVAYADSVYRFRLLGGVWRLCSSMNM